MRVAPEWEDFLAKRPLGVVATVDASGRPHAVPVEVVVRAGRAYVWCRSDSAKARNAARGGWVAIAASKGHAGVMVRGPARLIRAGESGYDELARSFLAKYGREETYGNDTLIEIAVEHARRWG